MRSTLLTLVLLAACAPLAETPAPDERPSEAAPAAATSDLTVHAAPGLTEASSSLRDAPSLVPGQWVVKLRDSATLADIGDRLDQLGAADVRERAARGTFEFHSDADHALVDQLTDDDAVAWVEPVITMMPQSNDAYFSTQWHLPALRVPEAWAWNRGAGAIVAVVDTGVLRMDDLGLAGTDGIENLLPQMDYVPVALVPISPSLQADVPNDDVGHGTHIAHTIAQRTDNGLGGAGIAPDATILPIRALGAAGGSSTDVADAIRYAADQGAHVINLSLGSPLYSEAIAEACQYAFDQGAVLIAASGNDAASHHVSYPAALDTVLAVGAVGSDRIVADYSNRGPELDVVAPGGIFYDVDRDGLFDGIFAETWQVWVGIEGVEDGVYVGGAAMMGTSMATATVSGVAALLVAEGADRDQVYALLTGTAADLGALGWDADHGHGLIDAAAALEALAGLPPEPEPVAPRAADALVPGDLVFTEIMADPTWCGADSCEWFEVQNVSATAVDLAGLVVRDVSGASGVVDASVVLAPGALAVLGRGGAGNWNQPDITPDAFYGAAVTLNNSGDALWLANAHGDVAQSVAWGSTTPGASLALVGADPLLLSAWATSTVTLPTTGERATPRAR